MALLETIDFIGPLGNLSAYKMRGTDKTVLRKKGGATKEQIKTSPRFAVPRLYMSEFAGCATMGKEVRRMLVPLRGLADYNISGPINKLLKVVQKQDTSSKLGRRSILLSKYPRILEGFSFNRKNPFDSLVRNTLAFSLDREIHSAKVDIAALMRDINFFPNNNHPMFSITIALGVVPDFIFNDATGLYEAPKWYDASFGAKEVSTPWYIVKEGSPATTLAVALDKIPQGEAYSLVLAIGIRFGTLYGGGVIEQVRYAGAAKVLALRGGDTPMASGPDDDEGVMEEEVPDRKWEEMKESLPEGIVVRGNVDTTGGVQAIYTFAYNDGNRKEGVDQVYGYTLAVRESQAKWEVDASPVREGDVMVVKGSLKTSNMEGASVAMRGPALNTRPAPSFIVSYRSTIPGWRRDNQWVFPEAGTGVVDGRYKRHSRRSSFRDEDHLGLNTRERIVEGLKIEALNGVQHNCGYTPPFRRWVIQSDQFFNHTHQNPWLATWRARGGGVVED